MAGEHPAARETGRAEATRRLPGKPGPGAVTASDVPRCERIAARGEMHRARHRAPCRCFGATGRTRNGRRYPRTFRDLADDPATAGRRAGLSWRQESRRQGSVVSRHVADRRTEARSRRSACRGRQSRRRGSRPLPKASRSRRIGRQPKSASRATRSGSCAPTTCRRRRTAHQNSPGSPAPAAVRRPRAETPATARIPSTLMCASTTPRGGSVRGVSSQLLNTWSLTATAVVGTVNGGTPLAAFPTARPQALFVAGEADLPGFARPPRHPFEVLPGFTACQERPFELFSLVVRIGV